MSVKFYLEFAGIDSGITIVNDEGIRTFLHVTMLADLRNKIELIINNVASRSRISQSREISYANDNVCWKMDNGVPCLKPIGTCGHGTHASDFYKTTNDVLPEPVALPSDASKNEVVGVVDAEVDKEDMPDDEIDLEALEADSVEIVDNHVEKVDNSDGDDIGALI